MTKPTRRPWAQRVAGPSVTVAAAAAAWLIGFGPAPASAAEQVVITGSVTERAIVDAPYAVTALPREELRGAGPLVNLSEAMGSVPGFVVANRWNFAQDLQISSRGFGARAGFGVRGVRLYADGIPASGPDGQGQVSHFDLAGAGRIEVLRGPFSVLYGNSSGGVISLISATPTEPQAETAAEAGSFGLHQLRLAGATPLGSGLDGRLGAASLSVRGHRPHAEASRSTANLRLGWQGGSDLVTFALGELDMPANDPLGLTRLQFDADPLQASPVALQFNTRKTTRQTQGGLSWRHRFDGGLLREASLMAYQGRRAVVQFLAIPVAAQGNANHGGGVIDFDREYQGTEARLRLGWEALDVVAGVALDRQRDDRRGYNNFTGTGATQVLGIVGTLRRDEVDRARSDDAYVQAEWTPAAGALAISAGVRGGRARLSVDDHYVQGTNLDDSGSREFSYTNPVLGVRVPLASGMNLHASVARGYESPTLGDVAYRPDGNSGLNFALEPQRSEQAEVGLKWRTQAWQVDAALFEIRVEDEISVFSNAGGRATFQNVGRTLRRGAELALRWQIAASWRARLTASWLDATYRDPFLACAGTGCTAPTLPVPAGNRIAGTQRHGGFADVAWLPLEGAELGVEARGVGSTMVNDTNSDRAAGYGLVGVRWRQRVGVSPLGHLEVLLRVENAFDRRYAGSVIVNEGNARYFETGAPRTWLLGLRVLFP